MKLSVILDEIDYAALPNLFVSEDSGFLKRLISSFLKSGIAVLPQQLKDRAFIKFTERNKNSILSEINNIMDKKKIPAKVYEMSVDRCDFGMRISVSVNAVWKDIVCRFLPDLLWLIPQNDSTETVFDVVNIIGDAKEPIVSVLLERLDEYRKTEPLIVYFVMRYKEEICDALTKLLADKGISTKVMSLMADLDSKKEEEK